MEYMRNHPSSSDSSVEVVTASSDFEDEILEKDEVNSSDLNFLRTNILPPPKPFVDELFYKRWINSRSWELKEMCFKDAQKNYHARLSGFMEPIQMMFQKLLFPAPKSYFTMA
ncbi:unnamed protein product [Vicia faba]|uniref:Uncharacterized protein n=1 Tax=Vicia faba TaxID=3906 RepID=A0AAV0ZGK4_VICFA|nr:unnamed protein product [Vicia faba]